MRELIDELEQALLALDRLTAQRIFTKATRASEAPFVEDLVVATLERIGDGWERGTIALSQVYMSGRICEELIDATLPRADLKQKNQPRMAIAVLDDYHMLGKRMVYSVLRSAGFDVIDYGRVDVKSLIRRATDESIQVLLLSVLMLPSALHVADVRKRLDEAGLDIKIVVGGAPFRFDDTLWKEVGAHAMGRNAADAVAIVRRLAEGK